MFIFIRDIVCLSELLYVEVYCSIYLVCYLFVEKIMVFWRFWNREIISIISLFGYFYFE